MVKAANEKSIEIDITTWHFPETDDLIGHIVKSISNTIREQFVETPPDIDFPICADPSEPMVVQVSIPLGPSEDDIIYYVSLREMVEEVIFCLSTRDKIIYGDEAVELLHSYAKQLRELADLAESRIKK